MTLKTSPSPVAAHVVAIPTLIEILAARHLALRWWEQGGVCPLTAAQCELAAASLEGWAAWLRETAAKLTPDRRP